MASASVAPVTAVVLLSGGLDSATVLAMARAAGRRCLALSFAYGQRHTPELAAARAAAARYGAAEHLVMTLDLAAYGGSALTDPSIPVPKTARMPRRRAGSPPPVTYVPARNTVFLAHALAFAEARGAAEIHLGVNAVDSSGYPDCRPEFVSAFRRLANVAVATPPRIKAPLLHWSKAEIIRRGTALGVDYGATVTCYAADDRGRACGRCEACHLRRRGFREAGVQDPTRYA